jgi:CubicO group peptidase (beta-lactamase class C family)
MRRRTTALVLLAVTIPATASAQTRTAATAQQEAVNAIFAGYSSSGSPGCAVSVTRDGSTVFQRGYGLADIEQNVPITPQSAFYAASVSKQFTAAAIALLVLRGQLSLDANVRDFVPEVPDYGTKITVRHLLHHTSGLRDYLSLSAISGAPEDAPLTESDFLATISRQRALNFAPATKYSYSNTGYVLLSLIVRKVSGLSLREYATKEIFMPLGMTSTVFRDSHTTLIPRRATAYDTIDGAFRTRVPGFDLVGDGGLFTTAADLAKWNPMELDGALRAPGLSALMVERGRLASGDTIDYAMGLNIGTYRGAPIVRHGGSYGGYRAAYAVVPSASMTVALLCNIRSAAPFVMANRILDVYLGDRLAENAPATPAAVAASTAATSPVSNVRFEARDLLGDYFSAELDARWTIQPGISDGIALQRRNLAPMPLSVFDTAQLRFTMPDTPLALRFERDGSGRVTGFIVDIDEISGIRFEKLR